MVNTNKPIYAIFYKVYISMLMQAREDTNTRPFFLHCRLSQMDLLSLDSGNDDLGNSV